VGCTCVSSWVGPAASSISKFSILPFPPHLTG
jgi:hypothetical protein